MKRTIGILFMGLFLMQSPGVVSQTAKPPASTDKKAAIEKLLEMTGALKMGQQMAGLMVRHVNETIRKNSPGAKSDVFDSLPEIVESVIADKSPEFLALSSGLYDKYFSTEEIQEMIRFYETPVGRKSISVMPRLMQESMTLGQRWGQSLMPEIRKRVNEKFKSQGIRI